MTGERVRAAQERVVARGVLPNLRISPGYVRGEDGVLIVERAKARIVVQAFKRRDGGAPLVEIQALLAGNGIERALSGVASMLRSRMYLGELHFGDLHNLNAHEPIIKDRALFERVQRRLGEFRWLSPCDGLVPADENLFGVQLQIRKRRSVHPKCRGPPPSSARSRGSPRARRNRRP